MVDEGGVTQRRIFELSYSRWNRILMTAIGLGPRFSGVVLDHTDLRVRMGWGFSAHIPVADVVRVAPSERPFFAWGAHGWRGRWLVNGSSDGIVAIDIDPPVRGWAIGFPLRLRTVSVSLADPDGFLHAMSTLEPPVIPSPMPAAGS